MLVDYLDRQIEAPNDGIEPRPRLAPNGGVEIEAGRHRREVRAIHATTGARGVDVSGRLLCKGIASGTDIVNRLRIKYLNDVFE